MQPELVYKWDSDSVQFRGEVIRFRAREKKIRPLLDGYGPFDAEDAFEERDVEWAGGSTDTNENSGS